MNTANGPHCDMRRDCEAPPTYIGEKGYIYCAGHAPWRSGVERCRKMTRAELATIARGEPIARY